MTKQIETIVKDAVANAKRELAEIEQALTALESKRTFDYATRIAPIDKDIEKFNADRAAILAKFGTLLTSESSTPAIDAKLQELKSERVSLTFDIQVQKDKLAEVQRAIEAEWRKVSSSFFAVGRGSASNK